jgi:hypothetical protein
MRRKKPCGGILNLPKCPGRSKKFCCKVSDGCTNPCVVPVTVENSERLYGHYFKEAQPSEPTAFAPKSKEAEADFFQNATADELKTYFLAKYR